MVSIYLSIAIAVGVGAFAIADGLLHRPGSGCDRPALCAVIAGIAWPVLAVGLTQILVIAAAKKMACTLGHGAAQSGVWTPTSG